MITVGLNPRSLPLRQPLITSQRRIERRQVLALVIQDAAGNAGLGEAAPLPIFGGEDLLRCRQTLEEILPDLPQLADRWLRRDRPSAGLGPLEARLADTPCARACIEGALLDLYAQRHGRPLADVLRSTIDDRPSLRSLPVSALLAGNRLEALSDAASKLVADGWKTLKIKLPRDPADAADQLHELRSWVGTSVKLRGDANGAWTFEEARWFCHAVRNLNLEFLEQPLAAEQIAACAELRRLTRIPLALDESIRSAGDVGRVASEQAADIVVLKPMLLGGWRATRQAAELARQLEMRIVVTTFLDGSIGRALAAHMAAALDACDLAQGLATGSLLAEDLTDTPLRARHGLLELHDRPGLGIGSLLPEIIPDEPPASP